MNDQSSTAAWHALSGAEVVKQLEVDRTQGLTSEQVAELQRKWGANALTPKEPTPLWVKFLAQFQQALVYILLLAAVVSALLGEFVDAFVIFIVTFVNAIIGFLQESKAEKALDALAKMMKTEANVRRNGARRRVAAAELVPGDIVLLQSGDSVPADLRLLAVKDLQINEAMLTGESLPVAKQAEPVPEGNVLAERTDMAYSGSLVTFGQAEGVVIATGDRTETGRIAGMLQSTEELATPLTRKIAEFSRLLLVVIMVLAVAMFFIGILRGESAGLMFMASVALAVGAIPEGLPAAVTITLAIGVTRMARRNTIIRKLPAVETFGSTTVICSDKTGTLTENAMTVRHVMAGGQVYEVEGVGYAPTGRILRDGTPVDAAGERALAECLLAGLLCNDSQVVEKDGRTKVEGDPTEGALIISARKAGFDFATAVAERPRLDVVPFESQRMFMATLNRIGDHNTLYVKGSAERILDACVNAMDPSGNTTALDAASVRSRIEEMSRDGLRVLAFAARPIAAERKEITPADAERELTLLGLQAMIDPPRSEAIRAVGECQKAGIEVKMITGDHPGTAAAIGAQLGLQGSRNSEGGKLNVVTGKELESVSDEALPELADRTAIFARVAPEQKLKLVRALQKQGHIVTMTGDGVNDAPALKQADVGVAMGITGTDVAKGAAHAILTDDNFASIEAAVEEGRTVFDNLAKFITWTIPTNGGEALVILLAVIFGLQLPLLPVQLLWINLLTAVLLGTALIFEPKEDGIMSRRPRDPAQPILTPELLGRTALVSSLMAAGAFALFAWEQNRGAPIEEARTIVVNLIIGVEAFYLLACRTLKRPLLTARLAPNGWIWVGIGVTALAQAAFTYLPLFGKLFHTQPITVSAWIRILTVGAIVFIVVESMKSFTQRSEARARPRGMPGNR